MNTLFSLKDMQRKIKKKKIDIGIRSNKDENSELKKHKEEKQIH